MPVLTTLEEYEALPEDVRAEVFDGQIYYIASPSEIHQTISTELTTILNTYIKNKILRQHFAFLPWDMT